MRLTLLHLVRLALVFVFGVSLSSAFNYLLISNNYFADSSTSVASVKTPEPAQQAEAKPAVVAVAAQYRGENNLAPSMGAPDGISPTPQIRPMVLESESYGQDPAVAIEASTTGASSTDPVLREVKVSAKRGDTMLSFLRRGGISANEAYTISEVLKAQVSANSIKAGQKMEVLLERTPESPDALVFKELKLLYPEKQVQVKRNASDVLVAESIRKPLEKKLVRAGGTIHSSLSGVAEDIGIPYDVMQSVINAYSYDVDFQREIQEGDKFEVVYESMQDEQGSHVRAGDVLYAQLTISGSPQRIYYHNDSDGQGGFYTEEGKSVKKALLRTPINGARISSSFGMRRHPVLGYSKMHRGVDFAAPTGTPIYAAGDGRIAEAGRKGSYGNYVRIRHNGEYSTAYAHTSRFAAGIKPGVRVKQGQVIAYVGTTGRSTGPHLHYEVMRGNGQINPMSVKTVSANALSRREMLKFKRGQEKLRLTLAALPLQTQIASAR